MSENMDKPCSRFRRILLVLFPILYLSGVMIGSLLALKSNPDFVTQNTRQLSEFVRSANLGFLSVFSGFLFDFIPISLITALLGITFLGPVAIPCVVLYKGIQQGIVLAVYLSGNPKTQFFHGWLTELPAAALASMVFLLFSIHICAASLRFPIALLLQKRIEIPAKAYFQQVFVMLIAFTIVAFVRTVIRIWLPHLF